MTPLAAARAAYQLALAKYGRIAPPMKKPPEVGYTGSLTQQPNRSHAACNAPKPDILPTIDHAPDLEEYHTQDTFKPRVEANYDGR